MTTTNGNQELAFRASSKSPEAALRTLQLRERLTEMRYLHLEYPLRRAFCSVSSEKKAWWSVWAISVFVERQHRFPRKGELYPYLHMILDESKTMEELKLPPLESLPGEGPKEAQRTSMERLQHENCLLRKALSLATSDLKTFASAIQNGPSSVHKPQIASWLDQLRIRIDGLLS